MSLVVVHLNDFFWIDAACAKLSLKNLISDLQHFRYVNRRTHRDEAGDDNLGAESLNMVMKPSAIHTFIGGTCVQLFLGRPNMLMRQL
jgi:hypothetical protein